MKFFLSIALALLGSGATTAASPTPIQNGEESAKRGAQLFGRVKAVFPDGSATGKSLLGIDTFNGIPYAEPPVGDLRLRPPKRLTKKLDNFDATGIAAACPQMFISSEAKDLLGTLGGSILNNPYLTALDGQEDCLTINVQRPAGTKAGDKLPVLFWIFGGGFELGATNTYDATSLLQMGSLRKQPFIFVAVNYRTNGFGFMPGKEILGEGSANAGLLDQRMGLEWVADNIDAFGGDPSKVTIWGESAGSISVCDHMMLFNGDATYKGKELFRGGIMDSGSIAPAEEIDSAKAQAVFDSVVNYAGCSGSSDALDCLRKLPYEKFYKAVTSQPGILSYSSVALSYLPRADGKVLVESADASITKGNIHKVPFILGDQEDEGTLFALFQNNITTTDKVVDYLSSLFFHQASKEQIRELVVQYPVSLTSGSPFRTGVFNEFYPGFKRMAAILGDLTFTLARRLTLDAYSRVAPDVPTWSYLASYSHDLPVLGTFHASDIVQVFYGTPPDNARTSIRSYYLNFLYNQDPNKGPGGFANWPRWDKNKDLMWFKDAVSNDLLPDDFRKNASDVLGAHASVFRV